MTKARSKAQRRRKASARKSLYPQFNKEAAAVKHHQPREDARLIVLDARCRHNGVGDRNAVASDLWGDPAGRAIVIGAGHPALRELMNIHDQRATDLWATFKEIDAADETYFRRIIGRPRFPNVAKLEYIAEAFEARADDHPGRSMSEDDRDRAAVRAWMRVQGVLGSLSAAEHTAIVSAMRQRVLLSHAGRLTGAGEAFVRALVRYDRIARKGLA